MSSSPKSEIGVVFYSRAYCHLCDEAREMLDRLGQRFPLAVQEVDIMGDAALYERYKYKIPVVVIDGRIVVEALFDEADLRRALQAAVRRK